MTLISVKDGTCDRIEDIFWVDFYVPLIFFPRHTYQNIIQRTDYRMQFELKSRLCYVQLIIDSYFG